MLRRFSVLLCVFCFTACTAGVASAYLYTITDMGPIAPDTVCLAYAVNTVNGVPTATGFSSTSGKFPSWTVSGGVGTVTDRTAQLANGATAGKGFGIATNGDIAGTCTVSSAQRAFYMPAVGSGVLLNNLGGSTAPAAWGLNASQQIVGYGYDGSNVNHAVLWNAAGAATDLGLGGTSGTYARAINVAGDKIVGGSANVPGQDGRAAIWTYSGGTWNFSQPVPGSVSAQTTFYSINSSGDCVGVMWAYPEGGFPSTTRNALLYRSNGTVVNLGNLGNTSAIARGINNSNVIVGDDLNIAFVSYNGVGNNGVGTITPLLSLLTAGADNPANWTTMYSAYGVDNAGHIVGRGTRSGVTHAFMLTPLPEPSTLLLVATGLVGLLAYAWRKRK